MGEEQEMSGVGSLTNPVVLTLFIMVFLGIGNISVVSGIGALMMLGLWIQGDPWIMGWLWRKG